MNGFSNKNKLWVFIVFLVFCAALMMIVSFMTVKNSQDSQQILQESVCEKLVTMAVAAQGAVDPAKVAKYESLADILADPEYPADLERLRALTLKLRAKYIYVLRQLGDQTYFVYDTDPENPANERFLQYDPLPVHLRAFAGEYASEAYNNLDAYGRFSIGAAPLMDGDAQVGIVVVDLDDALPEQHRAMLRVNMVSLLVLLALCLAVMGTLFFLLLRRIKAVQDTLYHQSHYDKLTDLPNRQLLFEQLTVLTQRQQKFSLFFIDLDNFKLVNDIAGHDAGDELLVQIGQYLSSAHQSTQVFRPSSGALNVAARIGGDEFILVAPDLTAQESQDFAKELIDQLNSHIKLKYVEKFHIGFCIGIAMYPEHSTNYQVLMKYADIAMYHAKNSGKNACLLYNDDMRPKDEK